MEVKVGGEWNASTSKVGLATSSDLSVEVQHDVVMVRAGLVAPSSVGRMVKESMAFEDVGAVSPANCVATSREGSL